MPKKTIIFCADGTWNGPEDATGESVLESDDVATELTTASLTNVVKLYSNLAGSTLPDAIALKNEDEKVLTDSQGNPIQVCKYLHGVGDSTNILVKFMGGIFGCGVVSRIARQQAIITDASKATKAARRRKEPQQRRPAPLEIPATAIDYGKDVIPLESEPWGSEQ